MGAASLDVAEISRSGPLETALEENRHIVTIEPSIAQRARLAVERMLAV